MRIVIFSGYLRPSEHLNGLLLLASQTDELESVTIFGNLGNEASRDWTESFAKKIFHTPEASYIEKMQSIVRADIVFGMPSAFVWMRLLSAVGFLKFSPYFFGPGFVTKAVGYFKHPERGFWPAFKTRVKFSLLNTYFICSNDLDRIYLASAMGYPLNRTISAPLPKHVYMNNALQQGDENATRNGILFAPTHRWADVIPPLTKMMTDADFIEKLVSQDFEIFHSSHPDAVEVELNPQVNKFEKDWSRILCVVTDYSSIGEDFILSGGRVVVSFIPDRLEFENHEGVGPFFDYSMSEKIVTRELAELDAALEEVSGHLGAGSIRRVSVNDYFQRLLTKSRTLS